MQGQNIANETSAGGHCAATGHRCLAVAWLARGLRSAASAPARRLYLRARALEDGPERHRTAPADASRQAELTLPLPRGVSVAVEAVGLTPDEKLVRQAIAGRLGDLGYLTFEPDAQAAYLVQVKIRTLGTEQGTSQIGTPAMASLLLPVALPEIALYKRSHQVGLARLALHVRERSSGLPISSSPWYEASTFFDQYRVLLFFTFDRTNLVFSE